MDTNFTVNGYSEPRNPVTSALLSNSDSPIFINFACGLAKNV